jgi:hypothetical protein
MVAGTIARESVSREKLKVEIADSAGIVNNCRFYAG